MDTAMEQRSSSDSEEESSSGSEEEEVVNSSQQVQVSTSSSHTTTKKRPVQKNPTAVRVVASSSKTSGRKRKAPMKFTEPVTVDVVIEGKVSAVHPETRCTVMHKDTGKKLAGTAAPRAKNVDEWLVKHPEFSLTTSGGGRRRKRPSQDSAMSSTSTLSKASQQRSTHSQQRSSGHLQQQHRGGSHNSHNNHRGGSSKSSNSSRNAKAQRGNKVHFLIPEVLEYGSGGEYISEVRRLHREATKYLECDMLTPSKQSFDAAILMANKVIEALEDAEAKVDSLPCLTIPALVGTKLVGTKVTLQNLNEPQRNTKRAKHENA